MNSWQQFRMPFGQNKFCYILSEFVAEIQQKIPNGNIQIFAYTIEF